MRTLWACLAGLGCLGIFPGWSMAQEAAVRLESLETMRILRGGMTQRLVGVRWDKERKVLVVSVSFRDDLFRNKEATDVEAFRSFSFPGVTLDENSGLFCAQDSSGHQFLVAERKRGLFGERIVLGKETRFSLFPIGHEVRGILEAREKIRKATPQTPQG
ncbi:hypothetical protein [Candidatus Methylacidithermus pantelleriae]|uniref:hypothetical protein n=1 Tax=Candidatus Methylacidithermus pantelleriae TaxID=2744239 RepID=UPI001BD4EC9A|nr:hypothetical protein [Candidatus Methylacidithermus pantelleriae]